MKRDLFICGAIVFLLFPVTVESATFADPSWPCLQRKVDDLSLGIMWPHPVAELAIDESDPEALREISTRLALRRTSLDEMDALINDFVARQPNPNLNLLGNVFKMVFDRLSSNRRDIISGIEDYSFRQIDLAEDIDRTRREMALHVNASEPDFDLIDKLEEKLDWEERIFKDRSLSLTYVCETPVILEKRLYSVAQALLKYVPK